MAVALVLLANHGCGHGACLMVLLAAALAPVAVTVAPPVTLLPPPVAVVVAVALVAVLQVVFCTHCRGLGRGRGGSGVFFR